jgi:hypothetical protein
MSRRSFASNQLLNAEDQLMVLTRWADDVGVQLGVLADGIHFDGAEPPDVSEMLGEVREMQTSLRRAEGLLLAYEIARLSQQLTREMKNDNATAR